MLEVGRSTKTYRASIELARKGYGEQAAMLNRALFESMAVARWINENETVAAERFPRAAEFEDYLTMERLKNTGWLEPGEELEIELDDEALVSLRRDFGKYNEGLWTGHDGIRELLNDIRTQFTEEEWTMVQNYLRTGHQENNQLLHSTAGGLRRAYLDLEDGRYGIWTGPSDAMIARALFSAHMIYQQAIVLAAERFDLAERQGLDDLLAHHGSAFVRFTKGRAEGRRPKRPMPLWKREEVQALPRWLALAASAQRALSHDHAEAIIKAVAILDCDCLGEAARGDGEVVEEADAAKQDQAEAVPAINESHRGFPFAASAGIVVVV